MLGGDEVPRPRVVLWQSRAAYIGPGLRLSPHRNAVATVVLGLQAPFSLTLLDRASPRPERARVAIVPPGMMHHLETSGAMAFVYLDPLSDDYLRMRIADLGDPDAVIQVAALARLGSTLSAPELVGQIGACVRLAPPGDHRPALEDVIRRIDDDPACFSSVRDAARTADLSSSRFQHAFREATGVPFRRYRLWRRMGIAARAIGADASLTQAAFEAGFSSGAHFSSAFRAMFGLSPSSLLLGTRARIDCL